MNFEDLEELFSRIIKPVYLKLVELNNGKIKITIRKDVTDHIPLEGVKELQKVGCKLIKCMLMNVLIIQNQEKSNFEIIVYKDTFESYLVKEAFNELE